ncbi:MAG: fumarylacetoacetate hydrolase [Verrucomicrobia bacterium]|jgi:2-dehydro-3-deoxy-D-arabinonate dehydratase|nr:fumarylacetoacetate hydrolase [Verrucomicrobiota bacterium]
MRICRFISEDSPSPRIGYLDDNDQVIDLTSFDVREMKSLFDAEMRASILARLNDTNLTKYPLQNVTLLAPVDDQEIWAAGVTYLRSKTARMEESDFSASAYDKVYDAPRPEIFFKSLPSKVVATGDAVGIRQDATWNVPEPELALVMDSHGKVVGYTIGNDMSSRDIEGENLLYLPQAKMYDRSCSLGPWIVFGPVESEVRQWTIGVKISRNSQVVFEGETSISQIKRSFAELSDYLNRSQSFPSGSVLLTGTGVVPNDDFTLEEGDHVAIRVSGIGQLGNPVQRV